MLVFIKQYFDLVTYICLNYYSVVIVSTIVAAILIHNLKTFIEIYRFSSERISECRPENGKRIHGPRCYKLRKTLIKYAYGELRRDDFFWNIIGAFYYNCTKDKDSKEYVMKMLEKVKLG